MRLLQRQVGPRLENQSPPPMLYPLAAAAGRRNGGCPSLGRVCADSKWRRMTTRTRPVARRPLGTTAFRVRDSVRPMSGLGRQRPFAASGSSRWPNIVPDSLTRLRAPPPPNVKFGGRADSRPRTWATSGIGVHRHLPAKSERQQPVWSCQWAWQQGWVAVIVFPPSLTGIGEAVKSHAYAAPLSPVCAYRALPLPGVLRPSASMSLSFTPR